MTTESNNWKESWEASPGPTNRKEYQSIFIKGFCMGTADIIPGVSGGTIAFITGIYSNFLAAIASVNIVFFKKLLSFDLKGAVSEVHLRFILPLGFGIVIAFFSTARLMHYLITQHAVLTWSLFFGLILASILIIGKQTKNWMGINLLFAVIGAILAYLIVGLIPTTTSESWWFIVLCGAIAVSAMILPGLSGSFLLLILGKYELFTGAIKNPFSGDSIVIILLAACGIVFGLMGFSRILRYFLKNYQDTTMALLTGVMIGAMRKVWPWKEVLETKIIRGKEHILQEANILPPQMDSAFFAALALAVVGFTLIMTLEKISRFSTSFQSH